MFAWSSCVVWNFYEEFLFSWQSFPNAMIFTSVQDQHNNLNNEISDFKIIIIANIYSAYHVSGTSLSDTYIYYVNNIIIFVIHNIHIL